MNINDYRRAMDQIVPDATLKERIMSQKNAKKRYVPVRRTVNVLLAAALAVACLFTVALAASPELRTAVLSFLHMEEHEQVPSQGGAASEPSISQAEIGQLVKAQYIKMDRYYGLSGNLLTDLTWSDGRTALLDYKFWEIKDNELIPVEVDMQTGQIDMTLNGTHYQGEFWWFIHKGDLHFFTGDNRSYDEETELEWDWTLSYISGRTDVLMLHLSTGTQMEYREHTFLYHLDTGETEDLCATLDPTVLEEANGVVWSDNLQRALITGRASAEDPDGPTWLYDREKETVTDVRTLGGVGTPVAMFADDDTLILTTYTTASEDGPWETVTCYAYDIPTGTVTKTLENAHWYYWADEEPYGAQIFGGQCVYITETGQVQVLDLKTGACSLLDGFTFHKGDNFQLNYSENKVLYYSLDSEAKGLGITQLGIIDLEKGVFIAFDREGYENLYEEGISWGGDNTVGINARTLDDETRYLLLYQF